MMSIKINHFLWHCLIISTGTLIALNLISVWNFSYAFSWTWSNYITSNIIVFQDELYSDEIKFNSAKEYSDNIIFLKSKYENNINSIIWDKLLNISDYKLNKVIYKIDILLDDLEKLQNLNKSTLESKIAQLLAIKSIIQDALDNREYSIDINLNTILKI